MTESVGSSGADRSTEQRPGWDLGIVSTDRWRREVVSCRAKTLIVQKVGVL